MAGTVNISSQADDHQIEQLIQKLQPTWCCKCLIFQVLQLNCSQKFLLLKWQIVPKKGKKETEEVFRITSLPCLQKTFVPMSPIYHHKADKKLKTLEKQQSLCLLLQFTGGASRDKSLASTALWYQLVLVTHREHSNSQGKQCREDQ